MSDQQYQLLVNMGPEPGKIFDLTSVSVTIGRDPMAEITINDPEVSRRHARLIGTVTGYRIQDLGSTNGTFVDGVRLGGEPFDLETGQVISIGGGVVLVYQTATGSDFQADTLLDASAAALAAQELLESMGDAGTESAANFSEFAPVGDDEIDATDDTGIEPFWEEEQYGSPIISVPSTETIVDSPEQEAAAPLYQSQSAEGQDFAEPVVIPHQGEPAKPLSDAGSSANRRLSITIAAIVLLLICCCSSFILFLYYYGGDWLLRQMGLMP